MKVGVVGASGLVGTAVRAFLENAGHSWVGFSRSPKGKRGEWRTLADGVAGLDAIVNVAGDSIDKRWTDENKKRFHQSRVGVTEEIVAQLSLCSEGQRPSVLINASAVGYYGDQGEQVLTEKSPQGEGYLSELCEEWEAAAVKAEEQGVRVVLGRIGVVLGREALAWKRIKPVFSFGGGGKLGSGEQYWPVVHVDDVAGGILHALRTDSIHGPLNLVSPATVTNAEFTKTLGKILQRPTVLPVPAFALQIVLGGFAQALLASYRVQPELLVESGYVFLHPDLEALLRSLE